MNRRAVSIVSLVLLALSSTVAATASDVPAPFDARVARAVDRVEARLTGARTALDSGTISGIVRAAAALRKAPVGLAPAPLEEPRSFEEALALIRGAVEFAESRSEVAAASIREGRSLVEVFRRKLEKQAQPAVQPLATKNLEPLFENVHGARHIDVVPLYEGSLAVAEAIEASLPILAATSLPTRPSTRAPACDVLDQMPDLCIGGEGDNVYKIDAGLLIDLGGNDRYLNSAGGADPTSNELRVSVNVDLDGNDEYLAVEPLESGARVAQGAGSDAGIGFLVDNAGDDSYDVDAREEIPLPNSLGAIGQGAAATGAGFLVDLAGKDSYEVASDTRLGVLGQGGSGVGIAGLADHEGNDRYLISSKPRPLYDQDKIPHPGAASARGLGGGSAGQAVFADSGGNDRMRIEAINVVNPKFPVPNLETSASAAVGLGAGLLGSGAAFLGSGNAKTEIVAKTQIASQSLQVGCAAQAFGFGAGLGGFGGLNDEGGDDVWDASARVDRSSLSGAAVFGMGVVASLPGAGIVNDMGGNDRYIADAYAKASNGAASSFYGQGSGSSGPGILLDGAGDDLYSGKSFAHTTGEVSVRGVGAATLGQAQGGLGLGYLRDLGGSDAYRVYNKYLTGRRNTSVTNLNALSSIQGSADSGVAVFLDEDSAAKDSFSAYPEDPACQGVRGKGQWQDCGQYHGTGEVRD